MKQAYEKEIEELKSAKLDAESELAETKVHLSTAEAKNKENNLKVSNLTKEVDTLKKELAKTSKGYESQLALAQNATKAMYEEKNKMLMEIRKLKDELQESEACKQDLSEKLNLVQDSVKAIG